MISQEKKRNSSINFVPQTNILSNIHIQNTNRGQQAYHKGHSKSFYCKTLTTNQNILNQHEVVRKPQFNQQHHYRFSYQNANPISIATYNSKKNICLVSQVNDCKLSGKDTEDNISISIQLKQESLKQQVERLKKQNQNLKHEIRNFQVLETMVKSSISSDWNIKSFTQQVQNFKTLNEYQITIDMLESKIKLDQEIIRKMENKITILKMDHKQIIHLRKQNKQLNEAIQLLSSQVQKILISYHELQKTVQNNDQDWNIMKNQWQLEKISYLKRISQLQEYEKIAFSEIQAL